jgi:hypothetical protein
MKKISTVRDNVGRLFKVVIPYRGCMFCEYFQLTFPLLLIVYIYKVFFFFLTCHTRVGERRDLNL